MLELKQPYYDHLVIQSNKSLNCLRDGTLCEQVVDKRVLRRQTKKRPILCFDLFCARKSIENTSVERKAKESSQMSGLNIFFSTLIQTESTSYGARWNVPPASHIKQSVRVIVCGGMTGRGLTKLNKLPTGQTLTSGHYMNLIVKKEVRP